MPIPVYSAVTILAQNLFGPVRRCIYQVGNTCTVPKLIDRSCKNMDTARRVIDMRSDTVTKPTDEMRRAMLEAVVGDDVYGEDPTVNALEEKAAEILGKEAALFVPTGTMSNLLAIMTHCRYRGDEVIMGDRSHISLFEQGACSQLGGVFVRSVRNLPNGTLDLEELQSKLMLTKDSHFTATRLVCVENTHNVLGGRVVKLDFMDKLAEVLRGTGVKIHLDGARLFNAATALGVPPMKVAERADSVNICLSKGLGAPIGSVLVGPRDFIGIARHTRKALGGGMRQVGVVAAPGLIALEKMTCLLSVDHENAKELAKGLDAMADRGVHIDLETVETNIVRFSVKGTGLTAMDFAAKLKEGEDGPIVKVGPADEYAIRAVVHHQVSKEDINLALEKISRVLEMC